MGPAVLPRPAQPAEAITWLTQPGAGFLRIHLLRALQQTYGNQAVMRLMMQEGNSRASRMIQAKLQISQPGDQYEREAEHVADQVMRLSNLTPDALCRKPMEQETVLRAQEGSEQSPEVVPALESRVHTLQGSGQPVSPATRAFFEPRLGYNLGDVRLHTDARAAGLAEELGARAFTIGRDIAFGTGQYAPETTAGQRLLAHELVHVVQQGHGVGRALQMARLRDFKDAKPEHDPSRLTDAQIEATDEYKSYMDATLVWQWKHHMTKEEARLACRLLLREMREGKTVIWDTDAVVFMNLARSQLGTLHKAAGFVGSLQWVPFSSTTAATDPAKLQSDFGKWLLAGGAEPSAGTGKVNCWEMVLFSAYKGGFTSKKRIEDIYSEGVKQVKAGTRASVGDTVESELRRSKEYVLDPMDPKSPEPLPGDIVIFTKAANHAAIARGTKDGLGRHKIISHWPPPDGSYKVKETTIEELLASMSAGNIVKFWSPRW